MKKRKAKKQLSLKIGILAIFFGLSLALGISPKAYGGTASFLDSQGATSSAFKSGDKGSFIIAGDSGQTIVKVKVWNAKKAVIFTKNPTTASGQNWSTVVGYDSEGHCTVRVTFWREIDQSEIPYEVWAYAYVLKCDYTFSDIVPNDTENKATVELKPLADKPYSINVKPAPDVQMETVYSKLKTPNAADCVTDINTKKWKATPRPYTEKPCPDCKNELECCDWLYQAPAKILMTYYFVMPQWIGLANAGPKAKAEWNQFNAALQAHENGHLAIFTAMKAKFDELTTIKGVGKSHDKKLSKILAKAAFRLAPLRYELEVNQREYDENTSHGGNQSNTGGVDVVLHPDIYTTD